MLVVIGYAVSGYRRGLVASVVLLAGFLGGAVLGVWALPLVIKHFESGSTTAAVVAVVVVLVPAAIGHALAARLAWGLRRRLTWAPVRGVDGVGGAAVNSLAVLLVAWVAASVLVSANSMDSTLFARQIKDSRLLGAVQDAMPEQAPVWFSRATDTLAGAGFPQVFNPFENEPATSVAKPSGDAVTAAATRAARSSVVKVEGIADVDDGRRGQEGSGFVYAANHVMTNAHVVAGVSEPTVRVGGVGRPHRAKVVLFDPKTDVAVLDVPGLDDVPVLPFDKSAKRGDPAVVAGFPENGGLDLRAATVANEVRAKGQDIYGDGVTTRAVYSVRSTVRPGNSGGPLLTPSGRVYGVVFARSTANAETGYVLTARQVAADAERAATATASVSTGSRAAL